jgi:nitrite reductase/ring-hydroxylating ferredoxin subunit
MGFFKRLFGICATQPPADPSCWKYEKGVLTVNKANARELHSPGGAIRLEGGNLPLRVLLIHGHDGNLYAYHNQCTHGKRRLDPDVKEEGIVRCCSIGQSVFDKEGRVVAGSAKDGIRTFPLQISGDSVTVTLKT